MYDIYTYIYKNKHTYVCVGDSVKLSDTARHSYKRLRSIGDKMQHIKIYIYIRHGIDSRKKTENIFWCKTHHPCILHTLLTKPTLTYY